MLFPLELNWLGFICFEVVMINYQEFVLFLKLHRGMCRKLSAILYKVLEIFPELEAARPRSKSGIQALCSLHVALEKAKSLLRHCSNCSKLYLVISPFPRASSLWVSMISQLVIE